MTIRRLTAKITGIDPLLMNNPQTVDRFNPYSRAIKKINDKKTRRTDEDYRELGDLEVRSKLFFDDALGIYVPAPWLTAAVAFTAYNVAKISKANVRGSVFSVIPKAKLTFSGMEKVKTMDDIVGNTEFRLTMPIKQGQVRVMKCYPMFSGWSFEHQLDYEDKLIDPESLTRIIKHAALYGGFGDFRPTYGRATAEVIHE